MNKDETKALNLLEVAAEKAEAKILKAAETAAKLLKDTSDEMLEKALVTSKADASNLGDHVLKKVDSSINFAVQKYVNGRLDAIKAQLNEQDEVLKKLSIDTQPLIDAKKALTVGGKAILWLASAIIAIGGAIIMIQKFYNK